MPMPIFVGKNWLSVKTIVGKIFVTGKKNSSFFADFFSSDKVVVRKVIEINKKLYFNWLFMFSTKFISKKKAFWLGW